MKPKVSTWLAVAGAGAALLAGCGGSSGPSTQTTSGGGGAASSPGTSVSGVQDVASCKHSVRAQKSIAASARAKLEKICDKAASGSPAAIQQVAYEACIELVKASHAPAGLPRQEALALCNTAPK